MELKIRKSDLASGISVVSRAVPSRTTMSILECIMIDASEGNIRLIANDMELGIETVIEGEIISAGKIAVNAGIFSNIVRKLPDNDVTIRTDGEKIGIHCENSEFHILGRAGEDFTYLPVVEKNSEIRLSQYTLKEMITRTIFSVSSNESSGMMTGELLEVKENDIRMVALDGHRISIRKVSMDENYGNVRVIISGKTLNEISRILSGDTAKSCSIYFTGRHILFEFDSTRVVSRLIEGTYYNIDSMLSNTYAATVKVNRQKMLDCIDRSTLLVREEDKKPIIVMIRDDKMELKINTSIGSMDEVIDIVKTGENMDIGFNPKFVIDALRAIDDEEVTIYLVSPKAPCFIRNDLGTEKPEGQEYCYLILPINFITVD